LGVGGILQEIDQELEDDFVIFSENFEIRVEEFFSFSFDKGKVFGEVEGSVHKPNLKIRQFENVLM